MKFLLLFTFVAGALATLDYKVSEDELARNLARAFRMDPMDSLECLRKSGATSDDLKYMENDIDLSDSETTDMKSLKRSGCALVCCAQTIGIMRGGEIQVEELFEFLGKVGMPAEVEMPLRSFVHICKEEVADISDECMAGYKFAKCVYKKTLAMIGLR